MHDNEPACTDLRAIRTSHGENQVHTSLPPLAIPVGMTGTSLLCSPIEPVLIAVAIVIAVLPT